MRILKAPKPKTIRSATMMIDVCFQTATTRTNQDFKMFTQQQLYCKVEKNDVKRYLCESSLSFSRPNRRHTLILFK